jgi:hypothetical protein
MLRNRLAAAIAAALAIAIAPAARSKQSTAP